MDVVVSQYCFAVYPLVTKLFGANLITVPAKNHGHDLTADAPGHHAADARRLRGEPEQPHRHSRRPKRNWWVLPARFLPNVLLVLDEAYIEFLDDPADFVSEIKRGQKPNLLLMRTFSKIFGLAGLRLGYGIGHPDLIGAFEKIRQPFNINAIAQAGALAALDDVEHMRKTRANNFTGLTFFEKAFQATGSRIHSVRCQFHPGPRRRRPEGI